MTAAGPAAAKPAAHCTGTRRCSTRLRPMDGLLRASGATGRAMLQVGAAGWLRAPAERTPRVRVRIDTCREGGTTLQRPADGSVHAIVARVQTDVNTGVLNRDETAKCACDMCIATCCMQCKYVCYWSQWQRMVTWRSICFQAVHWERLARVVALCLTQSLRTVQARPICLMTRHDATSLGLWSRGEKLGRRNSRAGGHCSAFAISIFLQAGRAVVEQR
jgi:hypothetical protein